MAGWLGGLTPSYFLAILHFDQPTSCHTQFKKKGEGWECAGAAIYRSNACKMPADGMMELPKDKETVFGNPMEFLAYHGEPNGRILPLQMLEQMGLKDAEYGKTNKTMGS